MTPDDRERSCTKHVEFYFKNKFEKSVHPVDFIIRIYHDARSPELQICQKSVSTVQYANRMYRYAPHNDVSANNGLHLGRLSHNIII